MVSTPHPFGLFFLCVGSESPLYCFCLLHSFWGICLVSHRDGELYQVPHHLVSLCFVLNSKRTQYTIWSELKVQDPTFQPQTSGPGGGMQETGQTLGVKMLAPNLLPTLQ